MSSRPAPAPDLPAADLRQFVEQVRRKHRVNRLLLGLAAAEVTGVGVLLLAGGLDLLTPLPVAGRIAALTLLSLSLLAMLVLFVLPPLLRPLSRLAAAGRIERATPGMHNRLITALHLRDRPDDAALTNPAFVARLLDDTRRRLADFRLESVVDPRPLRQTLLAASTLGLALVLAALLWPQQIGPTLARILRPTAPIPPASHVRWHTPGDLNALEHEPLTLTATAVSRLGRSVDQAWLELTDAHGRATRYPMTRTAQDFAFTFAALDADYRYRVIGGGTWSAPAQLRLIRRPVIEQLRWSIQLPDYTGQAEPLPLGDDPPSITAPIDARVVLRASVAARGEPVAAGVLRLLRPVERTREELAQQRSVWFDDDPPRDAELLGSWRWTTDQPMSGRRAHSPDWARKPYGFRTRLQRFVVAPEASLFLDVRPEAGVQGVTLVLLRGERQYETRWSGKELGEAGTWTTLEVPLRKLLGGEPKAPVTFDGVRFEVQGGRVCFDRLGAVQRSMRNITATELEVAAEMPMTLEQGQWVGQTAVTQEMLTQPVRLDLRVTTPSGHANRPVKAVPLTAVVDQPPTLVVERPGRSVVLAAASPLPLAVRVSDDWGLEAVGVASGQSAEALGEPRWLERFDAPSLSAAVLGALPATDQSEWVYRLIARDRKGQETQSPLYRVTLAQAQPTPDAAPPPQSYSGLLEGLAELARLDASLAQAATELLGLLPRVEVDLSDARLLTLTNPDGSPLSAEQWRQQLGSAYEGLSEEDRAKLHALAQQVSKEHAALDAMAGQLAAAAQQAQQSPLALPFEAQALSDMAQRAKAMQQQSQAATELDQDVLDRLRQLTELSPQQQEQLAAMQQQLRAMQAAQQALAQQSPEQYRQQAQMLAATLQGQQMMQQFRQLQSHLSDQQQQLQTMQQQMTQLQQQTPTAAPSELTRISPQQRELDEKALELMRRTQELMARRAEESRPLPPPPWVPPGEEFESLPVERDTPEEEAPGEPTGQPDWAAMEERLKALEDENWWDQPVDTPQSTRRGQMSQRYAERDSRPTPQPPPRQGAATPRQMLEQHQDAMQQQLTESSNDLAGTSDQLGQMMAQMGQMLEAMESPIQPGSSGPSSQSQAMSQLQAMMSSAQAGMMSGMAQRSATMRMMQALSPAPGVETGLSAVTPGSVYNVDLSMFGQGESAAAGVYRLPPQVRQPLLEGMNEQGPAGYQAVIDEYYRLLSQPQPPRSDP